MERDNSDKQPKEQEALQNPELQLVKREYTPLREEDFEGKTIDEIMDMKIRDHIMFDAYLQK